MSNALVSIVIPAFNRAHLIGETLDSIIAQIYTNWECLVVDDGSNDTTVSVITQYAKNDSRIKLFKRPDTKSKGANTCRNIGLDNAQGDYVVFFDSDDLMTKNHLEIKVKVIQKSDYDYVITKTKYFNYNNDKLSRYYQFDKYPITTYNYVTQKINWLTCDICLKTTIAKSISFNENLQSGQEYNYFSKLVHISTEGEFIDQVLTLRRHHDNSIRTQLKKNNSLKESYFKANWYTYLDLKSVADEQVLIYLMRNCIQFYYKLKFIPVSAKTLFIKEVFNVYGLKGFYFIFMHTGFKFFGRGYFFRQKLLEKKSL